MKYVYNSRYAKVKFYTLLMSATRGKDASDGSPFQSSDDYHTGVVTLFSSRSSVKCSISLTSTALNGHVRKLPPLRMVCKLMSSSSASVVCGQLDGVRLALRTAWVIISKHKLEERDVSAVALAERAMHARVSLPEPRVVPLSLDDRFADGSRDVEEPVLAEI